MAALEVLEATDRETAALDAYDTIMQAPTLNSTVLERALLRVAQSSLSSGFRGSRPGAASPSALREVLSDQEVQDFVTRHWSGRIADFDDFVRLYNLLMDSTRPRTAKQSLDSPQVLAMVESSRQSRVVRSQSPMATFWNAPDGRRASSVPARASMVVVTTSEDVPDERIVSGLMADSIEEGSERYHRRSQADNSGDPSPAFVRAGVQKFDYNAPGARQDAKDQIMERRSLAGGEGSPFGLKGPEMTRSPSAGADLTALNTPKVSSLPLTNETPGATAGSGTGSTDRRSRRFRERRLSKDTLPVDIDGALPQPVVGDDVYVPQSVLESMSAHASPSLGDSRLSTLTSRKLSLNEIVDEGEVDGGSTQRNKPSMQPRTAESASKAQLICGPNVAISREMGDELDEAFDLPDSIVGSYSCHGMEPGPEGGIGKINQDCACVGHPFAGVRRSALFSVYDGHGKFGHAVSQEAMHTVYHMLEVAHKELVADPCGTLADAFEACNVHLRLMACEEVLEVNALESGACAVVAFLHHKELYVAGVGDCRVVLGSRSEDDTIVPLQLSTDHKVDLPSEQARLESKGSWVRPATEDDGEFMPARLYEQRGRAQLGPGLCISRSLGDLNAMRCGLIPTPEVFSHVITEDNKFLILATDGVWEFIENEQAVQIVDDFHRQGLPAIDACRLLIAKAAMQWRFEEGDYRDDITAMVIYLDEMVTVLDSSES